MQSRLIAGRSRFVLALDQVFWSGRAAKNRQAKRAERGTSPLLQETGIDNVESGIQAGLSGTLERGDHFSLTK